MTCIVCYPFSLDFLDMSQLICQQGFILRKVAGHMFQ